MSIKKRLIATFSSIGGILASLLPNYSVAADNAVTRPLICSENTSYVNRRLDSDHRDNLCEVYKDKVVLVVNTASRCAFTGQYDGLEKLYAEYKDKGLVVVGFPSNDFGSQEPGTEKNIKNFCRLTYGVQFPMYEKTIVISH